MRRFSLAAIASLLTVTTASAQNQQSVPRAFQFADTLGANFNAADSLSGTSQPGDYDFLVGTWRFSFQNRRRDGTFSPPFTGHWVFSKKQTGGQGVLIEDHWRPDDESSTWDAGTWTYRAWNPARKLWEMQGINTNAGAFQPGTMWSMGADRVLIEWYGATLVRFRYFAIQPDKFLWRADATFDRGKTWLLDYWTMEVHRISK